MPRIRTVKPEFFTSVTLGGLPRDARLLFAGLWTHCDDGGRCVDEPRLIKGAVFPLDDDLTPAAIDALLDGLARAGVIERYDVAGRHYLAVTHFGEHQKIDRATASKLPAPSEGTPRTAARGLAAPAPASTPDDTEGAGEDSASDREGLGEHSTRARLRKGKERSRERIPVGAAGAAPDEPSVAPEPIEPPFANWPSAFGAAWKAARGGIAPALYGRIGRVLAPLINEHGQAAVWPAWRTFVSSDKAQYGPEHFASNPALFGLGTFGVLALTGAASGGRPGSAPPDPVAAELAPKALLARLHEFDLTRPGPVASYAEKVERACPDGMDPDAWVALVDCVHPADLNEITFEPEAERTLARRLGAWTAPAAGATGAPPPQVAA